MPPTDSMNVVIPIADPPADRLRRVVRRNKLGAATFGRRFRQRRSLIIQAWYGTLAATERLQAVLCSQGKGEAMKKTLMALAAVATLAGSAVAVPAPAHAQRGVAAGVAAGLIGGAIVGGAIASQNGYYYSPAYVAGPGYYGPPCYWQRFWDGYGWRARNVRICD